MGITELPVGVNGAYLPPILQGQDERKYSSSLLRNLHNFPASLQLSSALGYAMKSNTLYNVVLALCAAVNLYVTVKHFLPLGTYPKAQESYSKIASP